MKTAKMMCKLLSKIELLELENKALKDNMERARNTNQYWQERCDALEKRLEEKKNAATGN